MKLVKTFCVLLILLIVYCPSVNAECLQATNAGNGYWYVTINGTRYVIYIPNTNTNNSANNTNNISNSNNTSNTSDPFADTLFYCNTTLSSSLKINDTVRQQAITLTKNYTSNYCKALQLYNFVANYIKSLSLNNITFTKSNKSKGKHK